MFVLIVWRLVEEDIIVFVLRNIEFCSCIGSCGVIILGRWEVEWSVEFVYLFFLFFVFICYCFEIISGRSYSLC